MADVIRATDFLLESYEPPGGLVRLRLTHLPTGMRWLGGEAGQSREDAEQDLFGEAFRDLLAAGWEREEPEAPDPP